MEAKLRANAARKKWHAQIREEEKEHDRCVEYCVGALVDSSLSSVPRSSFVLDLEQLRGGGKSCVAAATNFAVGVLAVT